MTPLTTRMDSMTKVNTSSQTKKIPVRRASRKTKSGLRTAKLLAALATLRVTAWGNGEEQLRIQNPAPAWKEDSEKVILPA